jgi:hypothetical protein
MGACKLRRPLVFAGAGLVIGVVLGLATPASRLSSAAPASGECTRPGPDGSFHCLYRSMVPSAGLVAECRSAGDCRVGTYYGDPSAAAWLTPPEGFRTLPRPEVIWRSATLAEARFDCGAVCSFSYFFDSRRKRVSTPRRLVLDVDVSRLLLVGAEERALVARQIFSGREVLRVEREWATPSAREAVTAVRFDPDGRLSLTWLRGPERAPVSERVVVPSIPR